MKLQHMTPRDGPAHPAEGWCECGELVILTRYTNTCACGRDFDMGGHELAPREQWGEETGECAVDIFGVDYTERDP
jgi:hypothetical protein